MELNEFVAHFAEQFEETEASVFSPETRFRDLEEWSSIIGLSIMAKIEEEYDIALRGAEMKAANTIGDLFEIVKSKK